eukprot:CAMPEP_0170172162 /NCGR_PEP_ID=MMETSP0040_2-20121228/5393_1 /TAXON_ID=641309 /ORGANISM="Lotharella oceanica, Strain CCMP622" /LENGTH=462 /DNA_ID=CAMNT_0010412679 /DNA_START=119 /DNA_END=1507 /DNA_ORIENTATION=+
MTLSAQKKLYLAVAVTSVLLIIFSAFVATEPATMFGFEFGHEGAIAVNEVIHLPGWFRRSVNWLGQSIFWLRVIRIRGGQPSYDSWEHAKNYYEKTLPIIRENAQKWNLHPHLEGCETEIHQGMTFYDIVASRARVMLANLKAHGWADFAVEKDKCEMYHFISNNGFPHCAVLGEWNNLGNFAREGQMLREANCNNEPFCFAKMCHITMGHLNSATRLVPKKKWSKITRWAAHLWDKKPIDWDRTWGPTFDALTATLKPRVMIQEGFKGGRGGGGDTTVDVPVELKVEVVWGRAYLAYVTMGQFGCPEGNPILLRDRSIQNYFMKNNFVREPESCHKFLFDEGHMDVVWHMAESFAKAGGFDSIRVDIFVKEGSDPRIAVINEISLSSGAGYAWHWEYFSKLWVEGYAVRNEMRRKGKSPPILNTENSVAKISNGHGYYASVLSRCNASLISPAMYWQHCND